MTFSAGDLEEDFLVKTNSESYSKWANWEISEKTGLMKVIASFAEFFKLTNSRWEETPDSEIINQTKRSIFFHFLGLSKF